MSINDPQWGNSHRPEQKDPEQVPENTGTEPVQPKAGEPEATPSQETRLSDKNSVPDNLPPRNSPPQLPPELPPDLEVLWQQLVYRTRCRLARLLGRPLPPAPSVPPPVSMSSIPSAATAAQSPLGPGNATPELTGWQALTLKSWLIGVSLIVGAWLVSGFYLVDVQQRGVLSRFGSVVRVVDPGWHWRLPYPIDSVRLINVQADRTLEVGLSAQSGRRQTQGLMRTADGSLVSVAYAVVYQVTDPVAYLSRADEPTDLLALLAEDVVRDAVAEQALATVLAETDKDDTAVLQAAPTRLQTAVDPLQMGLTVKGLVLRDVQLPPPVQQAIKDAEHEEQSRVKALREAMAASTEQLIKAHKLAARLQDESAAYARVLEQESQAVSARRDSVSQAADTVRLKHQFAERVAQWRQQYPLLFSSRMTLQAHVQPPQPVVSGSSAVSGAAPTSASPLNAWRDRGFMRSRDRVDRPGSGS